MISSSYDIDGWMGCPSASRPLQDIMKEKTTQHAPSTTLHTPNSVACAFCACAPVFCATAFTQIDSVLCRLTISAVKWRAFMAVPVVVKN